MAESSKVQGEEGSTEVNISKVSHPQPTPAEQNVVLLNSKQTCQVGLKKCL